MNQAKRWSCGLLLTVVGFLILILLVPLACLVILGAILTEYVIVIDWNEIEEISGREVPSETR